MATSTARQEILNRQGRNESSIAGGENRASATRVAALRRVLSDPDVILQHSSTVGRGASGTFESLVSPFKFHYRLYKLYPKLFQLVEYGVIQFREYRPVHTN